MHFRSRGFTLIELMIVVGVVAILAAIALPSFIEQVRTSRRSDALAEAGRIQLAMERWRADNPSYANSTTPAATYPVAVDSTFYDFTLSGQNATTYSLVAKPRGSQKDDRCGDLTAVPLAKPTWEGASCD